MCALKEHNGGQTIVLQAVADSLVAIVYYDEFTFFIFTLQQHNGNTSNTLAELETLITRQHDVHRD